MAIDRQAAARALAKAIAYKQCGNDDAANEWARSLVDILECNEILAPASSSILSQSLARLGAEDRGFMRYRRD